MGHKRIVRRRIACFTLGSLASLGCGRTELDATLDWGASNLQSTGGARFGEGGSTAWGGTTSVISSSSEATGGRATGGKAATGGTTMVSLTKATGGLATGGKAATGGTTMSSTTKATGGLTSGGYIATGGLVSGGYVASGGATTALGGSTTTAVGGTLTTGGTRYRRETVTSNRATYICPTTQPSTLDPCDCDELPCDCNYAYWSSDGSSGCTEPGTICVFSGGFGFSCFGGVWRMMGGGSGGCICAKPDVYFGTGGTGGTGTGTGASTGGTAAPSTGTTMGGSTSTGGTSHTIIAPTVVSTGGSYSCPPTEPYQPQATCECVDPPCECDYTYSWTQQSSCGDAATCDAHLTWNYVCTNGLWEQYRSGPNGCECSS
jgi:hypothetical protein